MSASIVVDTNVLVYAYDRSEPAKQKQARAVLDAFVRAGAAVLTTQVVGEFFVVLTRKLDVRFLAGEAYEIAQNLLQAFPIIGMSEMVVLEAMRGVRDHGLSYYDAQIWATAHLNQVPVVMSEDFQDGQVLEGVRFVNPFSETFELQEWLT